ncbi:cytochrome P450 [Streptomyces sp. NPDC006645]|uniref:cytochrome P450 n=1 Tax=unclassified Streptomyces TaxID=2593676 RepID=UPI0033B3C345
MNQPLRPATTRDRQVPDDENVLSPEFWKRLPDDRDDVFAALRAEPEPAFFPYSAVPGWPAQSGFWAITRYTDIEEVCRNPQAFSSEPTVYRLEETAPPGDQGSMLNLDAPRHTRLRRIVARAFTPRMLRTVEKDIRVVARRVTGELAERGACDFATEVASAMPPEVICTMMGIPPSGRANAVEVAELGMALTDPNCPVSLDEFMPKLAECLRLVEELVRHRREHPADDLITALGMANSDGEHLTHEEIASFFMTLVSAGVETVRESLSNALVLLTEHPDQRELLLGDFERWLAPTADEVVRHCSPVAWIRRNVRQEYTLGSHTFRPGDRLTLYYASGNKDETVFENPRRFDITRAPHPHLGYGGPGPHYCLGAQLALREITTMLHELYSRLPGLHATAPPVRRQVGIISSVVGLPCAVAPRMMRG